jgi:hypothetical protein
MKKESLVIPEERRTLLWICSLGLLALIGCGGDGSGDPNDRITPAEMISTFGALANGRAVAEAATYDPNSPGIHPIVVMAHDGGSLWYYNSAGGYYGPTGWEPQHLEDAQLVAFVGDADRAIARTCNYMGGYRVHIVTRETRRLRVFEARTARLVFDGLVTDEATPADCPRTIVAGPSHDIYEGASVSTQRITDELRAVVE